MFEISVGLPGTDVPTVGGLARLRSCRPVGRRPPAPRGCGGICRPM